MAIYMCVFFLCELCMDAAQIIQTRQTKRRRRISVRKGGRETTEALNSFRLNSGCEVYLTLERISCMLSVWTMCWLGIFAINASGIIRVTIEQECAVCVVVHPHNTHICPPPTFKHITVEQRGLIYIYATANNTKRT